MTEQFVRYCSFTCALQWEIFLNHHLFWLFPHYKPEPAPRHFLPSSPGQKRNCFFTEALARVCKVSAQSRENKMSYFSSDLINLIDLLPSPQSQLNHNLLEIMEELHSPPC